MLWQIKDVVEKDLCIGCGACANLSEGMNYDLKGFLRPKNPKVLDGKPLTEFNRFCPGINLDCPSPAQFNKISTPEWGAIESAFLGWSSEDEIRHQGSSGGVISSLLIYLLESRTVDFVYQVGVSKDSPFENIGYFSRTRDDVMHCAGSRYGPAAHLQNLHTLSKNNEKFAFVGKPCEVAAVKEYAKLNEKFSSNLVVSISFMCAGVPSMKATEKIISTLGLDKEKVIKFKYRGNGWPGLTTATTQDGLVRSMDYQTSWGDILGRNLQTRCKLCPDGTGEFADIVCADAWHGRGGYPEFAEAAGRSLILARTILGLDILKDVISSGDLIVEPYDVVDLEKIQPYQWVRKRSILGRLFGFFLVNFASPRFYGLRIIRCGIRAGFLNFVRSATGLIRRI